MKLSSRFQDFRTEYIKFLKSAIDWIVEVGVVPVSFRFVRINATDSFVVPFCPEDGSIGFTIDPKTTKKRYYYFSPCSSRLSMMAAEESGNESNLLLEGVPDISDVNMYCLTTSLYNALSEIFGRNEGIAESDPNTIVFGDLDYDPDNCGNLRSICYTLQAIYVNMQSIQDTIRFEQYDQINWILEMHEQRSAARDGEDGTTTLEQRNSARRQQRNLGICTNAVEDMQKAMQFEKLNKDLECNEVSVNYLQQQIIDSYGGNVLHRQPLSKRMISVPPGHEVSRLSDDKGRAAAARSTEMQQWNDLFCTTYSGFSYNSIVSSSGGSSLGGGFRSSGADQKIIMDSTHRSIVDWLTRLSSLFTRVLRFMFCNDRMIRIPLQFFHRDIETLQRHPNDNSALVPLRRRAVSEDSERLKLLRKCETMTLSLLIDKESLEQVKSDSYALTATLFLSTRLTYDRIMDLYMRGFIERSHMPELLAQDSGVSPATFSDRTVEPQLPSHLLQGTQTRGGLAAGVAGAKGAGRPSRSTTGVKRPGGHTESNAATATKRAKPAHDSQ